MRTLHHLEQMWDEYNIQISFPNYDKGPFVTIHAASEPTASYNPTNHAVVVFL